MPQQGFRTDFILKYWENRYFAKSTVKCTGHCIGWGRACENHLSMVKATDRAPHYTAVHVRATHPQSKVLLALY